MPPPRHSEDETASNPEEEALILHRLDTDPRSGQPRVITIPSNGDGDDTLGSDAEDDNDIEGQTDEMLEKRRLKALARQRSAANAGAHDRLAASEVKGGRPTWLLGLITALRRLSLPYKLALSGASLLLLGGLFYFALGPTGAKHIWHYAGDVWTGGSIPYTFPSDVGYPGPTATGAPAQLEEEDKLTGTRPSPNLPVETHLGGASGKFNPFQHMGPLTPYKPADGFGVDDAKYHALSASCKIEQVHILHRHGSRYPTSYSPANDVAKLLAQKPRPTFSGPLAFLNEYEYRLGKELLVPLGRQQLYDSGVASAVRYGRLMYDDIDRFGTLFARAGSQHRIVDSARNWLAGALGVNDWQRQSALEIQIEEPGFNTTMAPNFACKNAGRGDPKYEPGAQWNKAWIDRYAADAVRRLAPHIKGAEMTPRLVNALQQLCSYDTVAGYDARELCSLFNRSDWIGAEYAWDLEFWGVYGSGSPLGAGQGTGWLNEFLARLTGKPWDPSTQTSENATLDSFPRTFPVDRRFYADFTHDSVIASVVAALDLPDFAVKLDTSQPEPWRKYKTSEIVPFAARLVVEKINCGGSAQGRNEELVRLLLNDAIVPLKQLKPCDAENRADGMCSLAGFLRSQEGRMQRAHWERCSE
ncbi:unnamed protein product [Parajaminaea phylloscopi]